LQTKLLEGEAELGLDAEKIASAGLLH